MNIVLVLMAITRIKKVKSKPAVRSESAPIILMGRLLSMAVQGQNNLEDQTSKINHSLKQHSNDLLIKM